MYKTISSIGAIAALAATAAAHGTVTGVNIDKAFVQGFKLDYYYYKKYGRQIPEHIGWYAEDLDNGFVAPTDFGSPDIICHKNASPDGSSDTMAKVAAGGTVEFTWTAWPNSHVGPVITYVAPYSGDISSVKKEELKWTKIDGVGYENGEWAAIKMIAQNNTWPVTVPKNLAPGKYVFRHEIIALHGAGSANGAQNYPQCLNIEVTGSGTEKPEGVVGTKLYTATDPGILFNVYTKDIKYTVPGPALFGSGSSGSSPTPTKPTPSTSPVASPSSSPSKASSPVASPAAPAPSTSGAPSTGGDLPEKFTIDTFITWLEAKAGKARSHARSFV